MILHACLHAHTDTRIAQLSKVLPYGNLIVMGILNGSMLLEVIEHSVSDKPENLPGRYCSWEGVRFPIRLAEACVSASSGRYSSGPYSYGLLMTIGQ